MEKLHLTYSLTLSNFAASILNDLSFSNILEQDCVIHALHNAETGILIYEGDTLKQDSRLIIEQIIKGLNADVECKVIIKD